MKHTIVIILIIFIVGIFIYLGYTFLFPKNQGFTQRSNITGTIKQFSSILDQKVKTDEVKFVNLKFNLFSPLVIKLDQTSFAELLSLPENSTIDPNLFWVSGAKGESVDIITLSVNGKLITFNIGSGSAAVNFNGKIYLITYSDPVLEGAVLMDLSTGKLYVVSSKGIVLN